LRVYVSQPLQAHQSGGQLFVTSMSSNIQNATVSQITGLAIHFRVVSSGYGRTGLP
jgi:hypothetical protein